MDELDILRENRPMNDHTIQDIVRAALEWNDDEE